MRGAAAGGGGGSPICDGGRHSNPVVEFGGVVGEDACVALAARNDAHGPGAVRGGDSTVSQKKEKGNQNDRETYPLRILSFTSFFACLLIPCLAGF